MKEEIVWAALEFRELTVAEFPAQESFGYRLFIYAPTELRFCIEPERMQQSLAPSGTTVFVPLARLRPNSIFSSPALIGELNDSRVLALSKLHESSHRDGTISSPSREALG